MGHRQLDQIGALQIGVLDGPTKQFSPWTFPRYQSLLDEPSGRAIAIGARYDGEPIGLALIERPGQDGQARLLSIVVHRDFQCRGIGTALLHACSRFAAKQGYNSLVCFHSSRLFSVVALEASLRKAGWTTPELLEIRASVCVGDMAKAIMAWPGMSRLVARDDYTFASWREMTKDDEAAISKISSEPTCRASLRPRFWAGHVDPDVSILVRRQDRLVGWVLIVMGDEDGTGVRSAFCPAAYIQHKFWRSGVLARAYLHGFEGITVKHGPTTNLRFTTSPALPEMMALTLRRFAPVARWVDEWRMSRLVLPGGSPTQRVGNSNHETTMRVAGPTAEILPQQHEFLHTRECTKAFADVLSLREHWVRRESEDYYTLGALAGLDAVFSYDNYINLAKKTNPLLISKFGGLLERIRQFFTEFFNMRCFYNPSYGVPGFHIFPLEGRNIERDEIAGRAHLDLQWMRVMPESDPEHTVSFTVTIEQPRDAVSLAIWPIRREEMMASGISSYEYATSNPPHLIKYKSGHILLHDGNALHAIGPLENVPMRGYRVTLQGHGIRTPDGWLLYW